MLGQKLAALLCSELKGTGTFQQRREDGGLWGTSSQGAGGRKGLVGGRGGVSLKDGEFVVRNKALPGSCCFSTSASECTFPSCSDSVFLLLLFYIVTKSREHKIYHLAVLQHTVHWYQIQSHCYAASSTIPPRDISHPVHQKLRIYEIMTALPSPWQPSFDLLSPCI